MNAFVKIPMQLFILFIGAMVFVLSLFSPSPMIFESSQLKLAANHPQFKQVETDYQKSFAERRAAALHLVDNDHGNRQALLEAASQLHAAEKRFETVRNQALALTAQRGTRFDDTNYIFVSFVLRFLPVGLVGLVIGVIFSASMSSTSGEINSLATVSVIDGYKRFLAPERSDRHYLLVSRLMTVFWGAFAIVFAAAGARGFGALIERVNIVGSLFYGGMLGVFLLAFFFKQVGGTAAFYGVLAGEASILVAASFTSLSFLWYNVVGSLVVVLTAIVWTTFARSRQGALTPEQ